MQGLKRCWKNRLRKPKWRSEAGPKSHPKPPNLKSGAGLGRESGKKHENIKSVPYLPCFQDVQALPKTWLFIKFGVPNLYWSIPRKGSKQKEKWYHLSIDNIQKRAPERFGWTPGWTQNPAQINFAFRSRASALQLLVLRVPGRGYQTQMDPKIYSK